MEDFKADHPIPDSFVRNCFIKKREEDSYLFYSTAVGIFARLNGYAIIPTEEYEKLSGIKMRSNETPYADSDPGIFCYCYKP